jgi:hypothetical protein
MSHSAPIANAIPSWLASGRSLAQHAQRVYRYVRAK